MKMWFEVEENIDVSLMLDSQVGGINTQKFCTQLVKNQVKIVEFKTNAEIEEWKKYYIDMHPKQNLTEDLLPTSITDDEIKRVFEKYFKPLSADCCCVTIIDQYIFAKKTKVDLLVSILEKNVGSKQLRLITTLTHSDSVVKTEIETKLSNLGFNISIEDRNDIHDRWWYTRKKGFSCGTSFNGISHKTTMMNLIPDKDLNDIIKLYGI